MTLGERLQALDENVELVVAALIGDIEDVAKTLGRDERGARALALDDGVGRERRSVHEHVEIARPQFGGLEELERARDDRLLGRTGRGEDLERQAPRPGLDHDVRKGAADIDRQAIEEKLRGWHRDIALSPVTRFVPSGRDERPFHPAEYNSI